MLQKFGKRAPLILSTFETKGRPVLLFAVNLQIVQVRFDGGFTVPPFREDGAKLRREKAMKVVPLKQEK